jgi:hypothetical protein
VHIGKTVRILNAWNACETAAARVERFTIVQAGRLWTSLQETAAVYHNLTQFEKHLRVRLLETQIAEDR